MHKIVIYGTAKISEITMQDLGDYGVVAFAADKQYITSKSFLGLPLVDFEEVDEIYPPYAFNMMVLRSHRFMREREASFLRAKNKGYYLPNFVSPKADVAGVIMGENNFIFSQVYIGHFSKLGNNNLIRPQTYMGHDVVVGNHVYVSPGCNIAGYCQIGDLSFLGIGSTIGGDRLHVARETLLGAGSLLLKDTDEYSMYIGVPCKKVKEHQEHGIII